MTFRAVQLATLASRLAKAGQANNAAAAIDRALEIAKRLAEQDPATHEPLLARTLQTFAHLFPRSRASDSLAAMRQAVDIYARMATDNPDLEPAYAAALNAMFPLSITAGQTDDSEAAVRRAVSIYERLAAKHRDAYQPDLARSLYNLTIYQMQQRQFDQALDSAEKLASILTDLVRHAPTRFDDDYMLAMLDVGFLRLELAKPDAATPLVCAVAFSLIGEVKVEHHSTPFQAAKFLRKLYCESADEIAAVWHRLTQRPLPDWLTAKNIDFTESVWLQYAMNCGKTEVVRPLAELLEKQGKSIEAEQLYRSAAAEGDTQAMLRLGTLLRRRGRLDDAETMFRDASAGGNTEAMTNLALLIAMRGDLAEAETMAHMAADFGNIRAMNVLGAIKLQQGQPADAENWLRQAAMAGDRDATNNLLGLLRLKTESGYGGLDKVKNVSWTTPETEHVKQVPDGSRIVIATEEHLRLLRTIYPES
jgi:TPR repeat protein